MRLSAEQKAAVHRAAELWRKSQGAGTWTGAKLVRTGDRWGVVWSDVDASPARRWRSLLVSRVDAGRAAVTPFDPDRWRVWWAMSEHSARTRRAVLELLRVEAAR